MLTEGHMSGMRYHKTFKWGIVSLLFCFLLFGVMFTMSIISKLQYDEITQNMLTTNAMITDIKIDHYSFKYGNYEQEMQIVYVVDGKTYNRELATDTKNAFEAGFRTHFSVGDVVEIYYNPENPMEIATELSSKHSVNTMIFTGACLIFLVAICISVIITRKRFLISEEEYKKEKADKKKIKSIYKNSDAYKIRVQYFNYFLFMFFCLFLMTLTLLIMNTKLGSAGTKINSPSEIVLLFFVFAALTSPVWILSLLNRRFFGKVVCLVNEKGIIYQNKIIKWEEIEEIEYYNSFSSRPPDVKIDGSYARIIGNDFDVQIKSAPFMLLGKSKKYNRNVKASLNKKGIFILAMIPLACIVFAVIVFLYRSL